MKTQKQLRVLVACEYSGIVRDAFTALGHDAVSCDLLPTEKPGKHMETSITGVLYNLGLGDCAGYDLMIAHPPCTYLCSSGLHWNKRRPERAKQTEEAIAFVKMLMDAPIPHIAIENPIGCLSTRVRKPEQTVQPWQFGHAESKATCLWLKNLPKLTPSQVVAKPECGHWDNQTPSGQNKLGPSPDRWKERSRTYPGIAAAMAQQWSDAVATFNPNNQ